ncbi:MAG: type II toxin-antitoxin system VapC family toxin [Bryobacteraceae bacterium]|jgi:PIN domain nuclease of toxin-antitoxin system
MVTYLLDTAPFLWAVTAPERLSKAARKLIEDRKRPVFVSVASLWEVVVKARKGLFALEDAPRWLAAALATLEAETLPIRAAHVYQVDRLPMIHKDPFDRMLLAQAASEGWVLVSNDEMVRSYAVATLW